MDVLLQDACGGRCESGTRIVARKWAAGPLPLPFGQRRQIQASAEDLTMFHERLLKNASDHRMRFFEMRRPLDRPVKEMILAIDRLAQLDLVAYGEGDLIQFTDLGIQLT